MYILIYTWPVRAAAHRASLDIFDALKPAERPPSGRK